MWFHSQEFPGGVRFTETERRKAGARGWAEENGGQCLPGRAVQFYKMQNYANGVMVVRSERVHSPPTVHLEVVEMVDLMLRVFYHNSKRRKEKIHLNGFHISHCLYLSELLVISKINMIQRTILVET